MRRPKLSDLLIVSRPFNWAENRLVKDKDSFYHPGRQKIGWCTGAFLYAATAVCGYQMYQTLNDDWKYGDLSPTYTLVRYASSTPDLGAENGKRIAVQTVLWGFGIFATSWAADIALLYAARNRRHNSNRKEAAPSYKNTPRPL